MNKPERKLVAVNYKDRLKSGSALSGSMKDRADTTLDDAETIADRTAERIAMDIIKSVHIVHPYPHRRTVKSK